MAGRVSRPAWVDPLFLGVGAAIYLADQATKLCATAALGPASARSSIEIVGDWVRLSYATNTGAAFGMFQNGSLVLTAIALVAIPAIVWFNRSITPRTLLTRICLGALLGGAAGNLTDRIRLGYVVDFVDVGIGALRWPAFNVADSAFVVGIIVLCVFALLGEQRPRPEDETIARDQTYA